LKYNFPITENFESSCEESEAGQVKGNDPETPKPSNSLDQDQCGKCIFLLHHFNLSCSNFMKIFPPHTMLD
jgi:hypothetical protein